MFQPQAFWSQVSTPDILTPSFNPRCFLIHLKKKFVLGNKTPDDSNPDNSNLGVFNSVHILAYTWTLSFKPEQFEPKFLSRIFQKWIQFSNKISYICPLRTKKEPSSSYWPCQCLETWKTPIREQYLDIWIDF